MQSVGHLEALAKVMATDMRTDMRYASHSPSAVVQVDDERLIAKFLKGLVVVTIHVA